jgi:hypothetical protein
MGNVIDITSKLMTKIKPLSLMEIDKMRDSLVNRGVVLAAKILFICLDQIKKKTSHLVCEFDLYNLAGLLQRENDEEFLNDLETALSFGHTIIALPTADFSSIHITDLFTYYTMDDENGEILDVGFHPNEALLGFPRDSILGAMFTAIRVSSNILI